VHDKPIFEAGLDCKMMVVVYLIIVPGSPSIFDQLPGRGALDQGRDDIANLYVVIIHWLLGHDRLLASPA
jgi:hypothetical protein